MAKTQDLKRRIRSIGNTMQLTRAMKMVAAAKLRRAQDHMMRARPFAHKTLQVLRSLAARANPELNPLLSVHGDKRTEIVVLTGDKGLCGGFNSHIIRTAESYMREHDERTFTLTPIGKRGGEYFRRHGFDITQSYADVFRDVDFPLAAGIAQVLIDAYVNEKVDEIYLVYNEFKSAIQAKPIVQRLLPVEPIEVAKDETADDYLYEPEPQQLFAKLLPYYVEVLVFQALLESVAAEHAARMTAMEAATKNAGELIESLTLTMNRVRQASITTEIIEVVSGAEALG